MLSGEGREAGADANQWADVLMVVRDLGPQQLPMALKPVLALVSEYLTRLLIAGSSCIMKLTCHSLYRVQQFAIRVAKRHRKCLHVPLGI